MFVVGMTNAQRNIVIQYLNRRDGLRYYASAKPMSLFEMTGNRRRKVTDAMLPSISSNRSLLLNLSSQCMYGISIELLAYSKYM